MKTYYIHDNEERPFKVNVNNEKSLDVYLNKDETKTSDEADKPILSINNAKHIFIGKSPLSVWTKDTHGKKYDGNSILVELGDLEYICITKEIFKFKSNEPLVEFVSHVAFGGSYPYAIDKKGRHYLICDSENALIIDNVSKEYLVNPYAYQFNVIRLTDGCTQYGISKFYIGSAKKCMEFASNPVKKYKELSKIGKMSMVLNNGQTVNLTEHNYVSLMKLIGREKGLHSIKGIKVIHKQI